jgi:hypothetical protein
LHWLLESAHPIQEAERYLQNARELLSEKGKKEGDFYNDRKYVRLAGHAAWYGVLIALDAVLGIRDNLKKNQRPEYRDYQAELYKKDPKMINLLLGAYESLHKSMGYDGNPSYKIVQESLAHAKQMIDWASRNYTEPPEIEQKSKDNGFFKSLKFW